VTTVASSPPLPVGHDAGDADVAYESHGAATLPLMVGCGTLEDGNARESTISARAAR